MYVMQCKVVLCFVLLFYILCCIVMECYVIIQCYVYNVRIMLGNVLLSYVML